MNANDGYVHPFCSWIPCLITMSRIVRWETPFTDAFYPSVIIIATPLPTPSRQTNDVKVIVNSSKGDYPKYLVDFGDVLAFTCMEEGCAPERDFAFANLEAEGLCAYEYIDSPWLKAYEGCRDPLSEGKFSHYMIFGGDNNVEVITENVPQIRQIDQKEVMNIATEI